MSEYPLYDKKNSRKILGKQKYLYLNNNIMKKVIRLTESDITRIVSQVLNEQSLSNLGKLVATSKTKYPKCEKGDCKNGYGEYFYNKNNYYKGNYKNGEFDGYGELKDEGSGPDDISPNDISGYGTVNGSLYKGQFKNGSKNGYGVEILDTGGVYKGNFRSGAGEGYGVFKNRYGKVFKGIWSSAANFTILKVASEPENKQYGNMNIYDLDTIEKSSTIETKKCVVPTNSIWRFSYFDKNYKYYYGGKDFGFCWWARNVNNGKVFNLSELVKTNPKIQKSIDILNKEYFGEYSLVD
jgi:hypothetical protein